MEVWRWGREHRKVLGNGMIDDGAEYSRLLILRRSSFSIISSEERAPGMSCGMNMREMSNVFSIKVGRSITCLFASTSSAAFPRSGFFNASNNSFRASSRRSRSLLSTTKIMTWDLRKYILQIARIDACPPASHISKEIFLCFTVSTLYPTVGIVVTTSPVTILYRIVVFPDPSKPISSTRTDRFQIQSRHDGSLIFYQFAIGDQGCPWIRYAIWPFPYNDQF